MRFYRNQHIEELAEQRLLEFNDFSGNPLIQPIPIERFVEKVLKLDFLWEHIEELPGETILGALKARDYLIVLNEGRRALFEEKPGLLRTTIGHEAGHWDLFIDKTTLHHPPLIALDDSPFVFRGSGIGEVQVMKMLMSCQEGQDLLRDIRSRSDDPDEARAVNRYAAAILMPRQLLRDVVLKIDRTKWSNLYRVAEQFNVTISALAVRLEQLGLLYVKDGKLFESRDQALGQMVLPL